MTTADQRHRAAPVPAGWTRGPLWIPEPLTLTDRIVARAAAHPDRPAIEQRGQVLSYAELVGRAGCLARVLRGHGVGPESRVGVCLRRTPAMPVAALGVLLAGGAYVPVSPDDPERRRAMVLDDAGVTVSVVDDDGRAALDGRVPTLVEAARAAATGSDGETWPSPHRGQAAYVLYTSGSTGRPKGVVVEHGALADFVGSVAAPAGIDEHTRSLGFAALGFDVSVLDLLVPLAFGGLVVLAGEGDRADPARLELLCREYRVNWAAIPPALLPVVSPDRIPTLRRVVTAGEAPTPRQVRRYADPTGRTFGNWYGPTEVLVVATGNDLDGEWTTPLPLGRPLPGRRAYVLDAEGDEVPVGATGELCMGGVGIARGYLGSPGMTARRFVPDPRADEPGARMYRTGDMVRWQPDGTLLFLHRADRQVKIRGQRVEIGEIEAVLSGHPDIAQTAVEAIPDDAAGVRLVAYVSPLIAPDALALAAYCAPLLPSSMIPSRVYRFDRLPLTPSAKVDLPALRAVAQRDIAAPPTGSARAGTPLDIVAAAWVAILGRCQGAGDDFFAAGGDSLSAMRLASELRAATGREIWVEQLLKARTVAGIASLIEQAQIEQAPVGQAPPEPAPADDAPRVLTPAQRRLWFMDRLAPRAAAYNVALALRLTGPLDGVALRAALAAVQARHEVLRWRIASRSGRPSVSVAPPGPVPLPVEDLTGAPDPEAQLRDRLDAIAGAPFTAPDAPLWSARLLRVGADTHVLALTVHHAVFDGWSESVFLRDLGDGYRQALSGGTAELPPPTATFAGYAHRRARRAEEVGPTDLAWATEHLAGGPTAPDLPRDRPRPPVQTFRGAAVPATLEPGTTEAVRALATELGTTAAAVFLAAFGVLLRRLTGHGDLVVGIPVADRGDAAFDGVIGMLLDTVPVRLRVDDQPFTVHVRRCHDELLDAMRHREAPLDLLVDRLGLPRSLARNPLVTVLFNVLNTPPLRLDLPGVRVEVVPPGLPGSPFDLTLYVQERDRDTGGSGELDLRAVYNPDLYTPERMRAFVDGYRHLLAQLVGAPHATVAGPALRRLPLRATRDDSPPALVGVVERVEALRERDPAAVAIQAGDATVTRDELARQVALVAAAVRAAGEPAGATVAILGERCHHLPAALLGVLSTGARWVVLDHAAPPAVRSRALRAAEVRAVLACPHVPSGSTLEWPDGRSPAERRAAAPMAERGYLTLTSGTTGGPLPVLAGEEPLAHFLHWYPRQFGLGPADRYAMLAGLGHDPLLRDIFTPLCTGGRLCVPPPDHSRDPQRLVQWLRTAGVTVLHLTPPRLRLIGTARSLPDEPLPAVRLIVCGGDPLGAADVALARRIAPGARLVNAYGTTETPQIHAWHEAVAADADGNADEPGRPVPVGRAAPGSELVVLDAQGRPAAVGELGAVAIRSRFLASGYLGPVSDVERSRFAGGSRFHPGDLGRYTPDGAVVLAGRADDQVSIRGHRVELAEVEAALAGHPDVSASLATAVRDGADLSLVAFAVPIRDGISADALRRHLRAVLPDYAVPTAVALVARIPLTPNGKPDRAALTELISVRADPVPARSGDPTERLVTEIWRAVLGIATIDPTENFFEAGGHSLAIVEVASRLSDALARPVEVVTLFQYPTARALAAHLDLAARHGDSGGPDLDRVAAQVADRQTRARARRLSPRRE